MSWRNLSSLGLRRAKKSVLIEAYLDLTGQDGDDAYSHPSTKAGLIEEIEHLREHEREQIFRDRGKTTVRADLCKIPAREINEWLRSLAV